MRSGKRRRRPTTPPDPFPWRTAFRLAFVAVLLLLPAAAWYGRDAALDWLARLRPGSEAPALPPAELPPLPPDPLHADIARWKQLPATIAEIELFAIKGNRGKAIQLCEAALQDDPGQPRLLAALGRLYMQEKRFADAAETLHDALRAAPADLSLRLDLAHACRANGDVKTASEAVAWLLEDARHSIPALLLAGQIATAQKDLDNAAMYYRRVLDLDAKHAVAQGALADIFYDQDEMEKAIPLYEEIVNRREADTAVVTKLATAYAQILDPGGAADTLLWAAGQFGSTFVRQLIASQAFDGIRQAGRIQKLLRTLPSESLMPNYEPRQIPLDVPSPLPMDKSPLVDMLPSKK